MRRGRPACRPIVARAAANAITAPATMDTAPTTWLRATITRPVLVRSVGPNFQLCARAFPSTLQMTPSGTPRFAARGTQSAALAKESNTRTTAALRWRSAKPVRFTGATRGRTHNVLWQG